MKTIQSPDKITNIIHISDIHIRNGNSLLCRYDEYNCVFENLINNLKQLENINTTVCVITGDTFHHKSKLETPGIKLFNKFIKNLSNLCYTYIILGNHDFKQEDVESSIDFLDAFKSNFNDKIEFLEETGLYKASNVLFGLFSVKDSLKIGAGSGAIDILPEFPKPLTDDNEIDTKVALFHGTIIHSKVSNTRSLDDGYPFEWLDVGYDFALLGDVHLRQQLIRRKSSNLIAAYSGSLIQQNFGEELLNHGYINWNLNNKSLTFHNVKNEFGFLKLQFKNNTFFLDETDISIEEALKDNNFPSVLKIRLNGNFVSNDVLHLKELLKNKICHFDNISLKNKEEIREDVNSNELFKNYLQKHNIQDLIIPNSDNLKISTNCQDIKEAILKKTTDIEKYYTQLTETDNIKQISNFYIKSLKFEGVLCYKEENTIDFTKFDDKINLISAKNGGGKSSLFEIICIAIFGKTDKSIVTKTTPRKCYTDIDIILNDTPYKILRSFDVKDSKPLKKNYGVFKGNDLITVALDNAKTNLWVKEKIGNLNDFLSKFMMKQSNEQSFLSMKSTEQKNFIDNAFGLTNIKTKIDYLEKVKKSLKSILKTIDVSKKIHANAVEPHIDTQNFTENIDEINKEIEELNVESHFDSKIDDLKLSEIDIQNKIDSFQNKDTNDKELIENKHSNLLEKLKERQDKELVLIENENRLLNDISNLRKNTHKIDTSKEVVQKTLSFIYKFETRIEEFSEKIKEIDDYNNIKNDLSETLKKLKTLSDELNIPFNPSCHACIKNPIRIQAKRLEEHKEELEEKIAKYNLVGDYMVKYDKMKEILNEYNRFKIFKKSYETIEKHYKENEEIYLKIENYEKEVSENRNELSELRNKIFKIKIKLDEYSQTIKQFAVNEMENQLKYWKHVLIEKKSYEIYKGNRIKNVELQNTLQNLKTQLAISKMKNDENEKKIVKYKKIEELYEDVKGKKETIDKQCEILSKYSKYIYNDFILPKIKEKANQLIRSVSDNLEIEYKFDEETLEFYGKTNEYEDIDTKNLSGFEHFISSLSIRIAIIELTSTKIQIFIDEGFTSCDFENINKVPTFLSKLTDIFKSIVLVSHIEIIKDNVDNVYEIIDFKIKV
ncbi:metallo-phosphoesterase [Aureococcus anophagefferens virus]|uniref:Putative DNA repairing ATPase n=1 Tax=Aureococcus anophagefferens virus TaxID=1474867 RepID=A0A076FMQ1_9VIRU|nr:metallo-phosphoesterase [Aureococcus anophagefferens virus]AII17213.1 putative DNA repairing ATPase [Aureococcus anophagefferens virus]UOG94196.1 bis(5'-nucleosyl)-tetraphosphatase-like protein [Aureococcus anophagefferens virus]